MATFDEVGLKYSMRYTVSDGNESTGRTIAGLNTRYSTQDPDLGVFSPLRGIEQLVDVLQSFSDGTIGNVRWITEQGVDL